jgi:hypothetical protein
MLPITFSFLINNITPLYQHNLQDLPELNNEDDDYSDMPPLIENPINLLGVLFNINNQTGPLEDIVVTTDENTLNTINILKITSDMKENCSICLSEMIENDEYMDLECKHIFHKECLRTYLKNYNHICPICRKDIGKSYPNI